jgi:hypothetical protein
VTPEFLIISAAAAAAVAAVAVRDHRRQSASRRHLLDAAAPVLDQPQIIIARDGFPSLKGDYRGTPVHIELICDSMVVRRLPQLWMSVTLLTPKLPVDGLGVLVRHAGNEFYALTPRFSEALQVPASFPRECIVRGQSASAEAALGQVALAMVRLLADPRTKEVVITRNGLRLITQAAEGARGAHLLLRQAVFEAVDIDPDLLRQSLDRLIDLRQSVLAPVSVAAA